MLFRFTSLVTLLFLFTSFSFAQDADPEEGFAKGRTLYQSKEYSLAIQQLKEAISANPISKNVADARFMIADSYFQTGNLADAKIELERVIQEFSDFEEAPTAWYQLAEVYSRQNNKTTSAELLLQIASRYPLNDLVPQSLMKSASLYLEIGKEKDAISVFQQLIRDYPNSDQVVLAQLNLGKLLVRNNDDERAQSAYQSVINNPKSSDLQKISAKIGIAKTYIRLNDAQRALDLINSISISDDSDLLPEYLSLKGKALIISNNWQDGSKFLDQAYELPGISIDLKQEILIDLGRLFFKMNSFELSRDKFEKLASIAISQQNKFIAFSEGADAFLFTGNLERAFEWSQKAVTEYSSFVTPNALVSAAEIAKKTGRFTEAVRIYEQFLYHFPVHSEKDFVSYELAELSWKQLGLKSTAVDYLKTIGSSSFSSSMSDDAIYLLGKIYLDMGYNNDAFQTWTGFENRFPGSVYENEIISKRDSISTSIENISTVSSQLISILSDLSLQRPRGKTAFQIGKLMFDSKSQPDLAISQLSFAFNTTDLSAIEREETVFMLASLNFKQRDFSQASKYIDQAQKMFPSGKYAKQIIELALNVSVETAKGDVALNQLIDQIQLLPPVYPKNKLRLKIEEKRYETGRKDAAFSNLKNILAESVDLSLNSEINFRLSGWYSEAGDTISSVPYWKKLTQSSNPVYTENAYRNLIRYNKSKQNTSELISYLDGYLARYNYTSSAPQIRELWLIESLKNGQASKVVQWATDFTRNEPIFEINKKLYETAYFAKGKAYQILEPQKAPEVLKSYINQFPNGKYLADVYFALGNLMKDKGDLELAASYFKQSNVYSLGKTGGSLDVANLYYQNGNFKEAITEYNNYLQSNSNADRLFIESKLITCYYKLQNPQLAERLFKTFEKKNPPIDMIAEIIVEKANFQVGTQDFSAAIITLSTVIENYSASIWVPKAMFLKAKAFELDAKSEQAAPIFQEMLKLFPTSDLLPDVYLSLGNLYVRKENYDAAIASYRTVVDKFKRPVDRYQSALNNLAIAYEKIGFYDLALKQTRNYIEQFPDDPEILDKKIKIGVLLQKTKAYEQAITYLYQLMNGTTGSTQAEILYNLGDTYFAKGDYAKSAEIFLSVELVAGANKVLDWPTSSLYMAGQCYEKMNDTSNALLLYERIAKKSGVDPVFKKAAQKEILRLKKTTN